MGVDTAAIATEMRTGNRDCLVRFAIQHETSNVVDEHLVILGPKSLNEYPWARATRSTLASSGFQGWLEAWSFWEVLVVNIAGLKSCYFIRSELAFDGIFFCHRFPGLLKIVGREATNEFSTVGHCVLLNSVVLSLFYFCRVKRKFTLFFLVFVRLVDFLIYDHRQTVLIHQHPFHVSRMSPKVLTPHIPKRFIPHRLLRLPKKAHLVPKFFSFCPSCTRQKTVFLHI